MINRKLFSLFVEEDFLWKWGVVAAHEKKKKKDIILSLLVPYVNEKYNEFFSSNDKVKNKND